MKYHFLISIALLVTCVCRANDATPDTESLLRAQSDFVTIKSTRDAAGVGTYTIRICPTNVCDQFESKNSDHRLLADYVYLYAAYVAKYVDFSASTPPGKYQPMHFVSEAFDKGYAKQVLDRYVDSRHCGKDSLKCVLNSLRKEASVKHFSVVFDEGKLTKTRVEDDESGADGPPSAGGG